MNNGIAIWCFSPSQKRTRRAYGDPSLYLPNGIEFTEVSNKQLDGGLEAMRVEYLSRFPDGVVVSARIDLPMRDDMFADTSEVHCTSSSIGTVEPFSFSYSLCSVTTPVTTPVKPQVKKPYYRQNERW